MYTLVAVDLDDDDPEDLLDDALRLLERLQATVRLVFVDVGRPRISAEGLTPELTSLLEAEIVRRVAAQHDRLERLLARVPPERRAGVLVLDRRDAAQAITEQAPGHDLVVVRSHGRRGAARLWLGSVAERVVRSSPIPVLVVRAPVPDALGSEARILAAVDLDDGAQALAADAVRWALAFRARVDALYVRPLVVAPAVEPSLAVALLDVERELDRSARARVDGWLDGLPDEVRGAGRVERGEAAAAIAHVAERALLVLIGTHGRRGPVRLWLGSVAERVVRTAPVPVVVVPLPP